MQSEQSREDDARNQFYQNYIVHKFADILRSLMRSVGSEDHTNSSYRTLELWEKLLKDIDQFHIPIKIETLFLNAVEDIRKNIQKESKEDGKSVEIARKGLMYLTEASCSDPAARGRTSQRREKFEQEMRYWAKSSY